jgi:hypothetical protein
VVSSGRVIYLLSCRWHGFIAPSSVNGRDFPIGFHPFLAVVTTLSLAGLSSNG